MDVLHVNQIVYSIRVFAVVRLDLWRIREIQLVMKHLRYHYRNVAQ